MNFCGRCGNKLSSNENYCSNCGNYLCDNQKDDNISIKEGLESNKQKSDKFAAISFVLSIIPIMLILHCFYTSGGSFSEGYGNGAVWWLLIMYYCTIGLPIAVAAIILGLKSNKLNKNLQAKINIFITTIPFLLFIFIIVWSILFNGQ